MKFKTAIILSLLLLLLIPGCSNLRDNSTDPSLKEIEMNISKVMDISSMGTGNADDLKELYELDPEELEDFILYTPPTNIQATELALIKAKDSKDVDGIKENIGNRLKTQADSFKDYLPEEYDIIQKNVLVSKGNYILFVIFENSDEVENVFIKSIK